MSLKLGYKLLFVSIMSVSLLFLMPVFVGPAVSASSCQPDWNLPQGSVAPNGVTASISTTCSGSGTWTINPVSQPTIASGSFSCVSVCSSLQLYSSASTPLAPGTYFFNGTFNGQFSTFSMVVSEFIVTPQFPVGTILAVLAPVATLIGYGSFRKFRILAVRVNKGF